MKNLHPFWKFFGSSLLFSFAGFIYGIFSGPAEGKLELIHTLIVLVAANAIVVLATALVLIIRKWRKRICDTGWKLGLIIAWQVMSAGSLLVLSCILHFTLTFTLNIGAPIFVPRC